MLKISRNKSLLTRTPVICNHTAIAPFSTYLHSQHPNLLCRTTNVKPLKKHNFLLPSLSLINSFTKCPETSCCNQTRGLPTETGVFGETQVIVGPMFAGKTSTLLKRMKLASSRGRFQGIAATNFSHLDTTLRDLCLTGRVKEAVGILCRTGELVHSETYSLLLQECIFRKEFKTGKRIHWQMVVVGFIPEEYMNIKLLILYAKAGDLGTAHIIFDNLVLKILISWNAMIAGYVQNGLEAVGLSLYHKMRQCGWMPDQYTFASVFRACSSLAILVQGKLSHGLLIKSQISSNVVVTSALMDMYFKSSSPCDGYQVFHTSLDKNVITWSALISGYGLHGRVSEVLDFFHQMISEGIRPNQITFLAVLSACSHVGLVDEGRKYFSSMIRDYGVRPTGKHYAVMVDLLGRSGRLEEAYDFVQMSPCKEHPAVWGALLGACRLHGNVEMVKLAAKNFFELEPGNAGKYVVLANTFASFGLWNNVAEVRSLMKGSGTKKEPGYSMIEVHMEAHFFFMGHNAHEQSEEIYRLLRDLTDILKDADELLELSIELEQIIAGPR